MSMLVGVGGSRRYPIELRELCGTHVKNCFHDCTLGFSLVQGVWDVMELCRRVEAGWRLLDVVRNVDESSGLGPLLKNALNAGALAHAAPMCISRRDQRKPWLESQVKS